MLLYKRLEKGRFTVRYCDDNKVIITQKTLSWLLAGLDWVTLSGMSVLQVDALY